MAEKKQKKKKRYAWVRVDNMKSYQPQEISLTKPADTDAKWPSEIWWKLPIREDKDG